MAKKKSKTKTDQPDFEESLQKLEAIARELEEGDIGLSEALDRYEEGVGLLGQCHDLLRRAERRIELLSGVDVQGNPISTPLDDDSGADSTTLAQNTQRRSRRRSVPGASPPNEDDEREAGHTDVDSSGTLF